MRILLPIILQYQFLHYHMLELITTPKNDLSTLNHKIFKLSQFFPQKLNYSDERH